MTSTVITTPISATTPSVASTPSMPVTTGRRKYVAARTRIAPMQAASGTLRRPESGSRKHRESKRSGRSWPPAAEPASYPLRRRCLSVTRTRRCSHGPGSDSGPRRRPMCCGGGRSVRDSRGSGRAPSATAASRYASASPATPLSRTMRRARLLASRQGDPTACWSVRTEAPRTTTTRDGRVRARGQAAQRGFRSRCPLPSVCSPRRSVRSIRRSGRLDRRARTVRPRSRRSAVP
jgi:hypothetical protein